MKQQKTLLENNQQEEPADEEELNKSAEEIQFNMMGGETVAQVDEQLLPDDDF